MKKQNDTEIEIDLLELVGEMLRHWWIILLATVVFGVAGLLYSTLYLTPEYESTTSIYILSKQNENAMTYNDTQLATQLTKDYEQLITGRTVLENVIEKCAVNETYAQLRERVVVINESNTRIINITVTDPNPANAQLLANAIREEAAVHIKEVTDVEAVNVADEANFPTEPSGPSVLKWTVLGLAAGFALSAGVFTLRFMLDDTIKTAEDVEKYLDMSILALIPDTQTTAKKKKKKATSNSLQKSVRKNSEEIDVIDLNETKS